MYSLEINRLKGRIESVIHKKYGSVNKFCKAKGFNRSNFVKWMNGKKDINLSTFLRILAVLEISLTADAYTKPIELTDNKRKITDEEKMSQSIASLLR